MEAASARMAARDHFGSMSSNGFSTLQRFIKQACSLENYEPNLALNLEIADLINSKKGNAPREAAMAIVNHVNHRNPNVSLLALNLLDICVKNCGYPFQLQISTKEFLNELVRKFPERPPIRPTRVQSKILEAIEEWRGTICQTSRYKDDLGYVRDMHRLLSYKGYVFPEVKREDAAVLNPSDNLKSAEEMEEEERAAQSAKLQELIRRGGPEDLQEANRLMKIMAGYDTRQKTDYRAKAAEEVGKVQQKARLLEEHLESFRPGDTMTEGDVYEELASALQSAHPKIQRMCEEESDDHVAVAKLLEINDSINRTVERYKLMKNGDVAAASKIAKGTLGTSTGVNSNNELSLIDLDGDEESEVQGGSSAAPTIHSSKVEDDLLGLSLEYDSGPGGAISLEIGKNSNVSSSTLISSTEFTPDYASFSAFGNSCSTSKPMTPQPFVFQQQKVFPQQQVFAPIPSPLPNQNSIPVSFYKSPLPTSTLPATTNSSIFDFDKQEKAVPPAVVSATVATAIDDDEWAFSSALPEGLPSSNTIQISQTALSISLHATRLSSSPADITISLSFSNTVNEIISELTFMAAVTKGFQLKLQPQSGRRLQPFEKGGVTQAITLAGVEQGKGDSVRIRWKTSYKIGAKPVSEQGEVSSLGIA
ncbi:putative ADP-ribosylation factor-binding protein [Podosphaera aphanis]|nr:putative ADP-ribosylation factor-binding protein [Podosphaera aphanis]